MTHDDTTVNIISYSITILQIIVLIVIIIRLRRSSKKLIEDVKKQYADFRDATILRYQQFSADLRDEIERKELDIQQRMNALSMENSRLREKNELLKEKLINLGFSETDLEL